MPLTDREYRFLVAADQAAGPANRFRWREVGASLGYSEAESREIADTLGRMVAIALATEREGQMLPLGRQLVQDKPRSDFEALPQLTRGKRKTGHRGGASGGTRKTKGGHRRASGRETGRARKY
jgi:hypothetical protein